MSQDSTRSSRAQSFDEANRNGIDGNQADDILTGGPGDDTLYGDDVFWACASVDASTGAVTAQRGKVLPKRVGGLTGSMSACPLRIVS